MRFGPSRLVQCLPNWSAAIYPGDIPHPTVTLPRQDGPWVDLKLRLPNCGADIFRDNAPHPTVTLPRQANMRDWHSACRVPANRASLAKRVPAADNIFGLSDRER